MVFLKKNKDPKELGSYRPITLINGDSKIYSKLLATRLAPVIHKIVSSQQHGFIPGRSTTDHIQRVITLFDIAEAAGDPMALILLDAEKAFDRVSWIFLWSVLSRTGLGDSFIKATQMMYIKPQGAVTVNGAVSENFPITRGNRQGCPCSPLLFALFIDPFIRRLKNNIAILPIKIRNTDTKILAYADDIAITTSNPTASIKAIEEEAEKFGRISGYKLNLKKKHRLYIMTT